MTPEREMGRRPYWHVDAKWVIGLILWFVVSATLLLWNLVLVTEPEPAMNTIGRAMALAFGSRAPNQDAQVAELVRTLHATPDQSIQPVPGLRIALRYQDIADLPPQQVRLYIFHQLAEPAYLGGVQELALLVDDGQVKAGIQDNKTLLDFFTLQTHQGLQGDLVAAAAISLFLMIPLILFSARFGRIGSPGVLLLTVSLPGALVSSLMGMFSERIMAASAVTAGNPANLPTYLVSNAVAPLAQSAVQSYLAVAAFGLGLVFVAVMGNFISWIYMRRHPERVSA